MAARPRFVTGPNGEILIGGGGHWLIGGAAGVGLQDQASMLSGSWQVEAIDGAPPVAGSRPALSFGQISYSGTSGCNALQGFFLAHRRRLFTVPGPQTEKRCATPLMRQEERIARLLAASPRIAYTAFGLRWLTAAGA